MSPFCRISTLFGKSGLKSGRVETSSPYFLHLCYYPGTAEWLFSRWGTLFFLLSKCNFSQKLWSQPLKLGEARASVPHLFRGAWWFESMPASASYYYYPMPIGTKKYIPAKCFCLHQRPNETNLQTRWKFWRYVSNVYHPGLVSMQDWYENR